jgi:CheY-like chemotaxis protein
MKSQLNSQHAQRNSVSETVRGLSKKSTDGSIPRSVDANQNRIAKRSSFAPQVVASAVLIVPPAVSNPDLGNYNQLPPTVTDALTSPTAQSSSARVFSILLVDDSPTMLKMAAMLLRRLGHTVKTAENGAVAVKLYEQSLSSVPLEGQQATRRVSSFDMILMDLQMPVMDGLEATRRIRTIEQRSVDLITQDKVQVIDNIDGSHRPQQMIVVGISANSDEDTMSFAKLAGFDLFLPKPFDLTKMEALFQKM